MAYDPRHYEIMAEMLGSTEGLSEKKMFGGVCFLLHGNMLCGVFRMGGMVRVGKHRVEDALTLDGAEPMDMNGRKMGGFVRIEDPVFDDEETMQTLLGMAFSFVAPMTPK